MSVSKLRRAIARRQPDLICVDCFDTLLLRGADNEADRIRRLGSVVEQALAAEGIGITPGAAAATRIAAANAVYRAAARSRSEGRHADMLRLQCLALGIDASFSDLLERIELEQEIRDLRPNDVMVELLRDCCRKGIKVVAVSDMYLSARSIMQLLTALGPAEVVHRVYSSSDHGLSKRRGDLFRHVLQAEGVAPDRAIHAGDCRNADYLMPISRGIPAVHLPRRRVEAVRAARRLATRLLGVTAHA